MALAGVGVASIKAASDLNESLNKAKVVFEGASSSVIKFSETSASSFGISQAAALDAASGFGAMAQSAGLSERASADLSVDLVKLAGDMASFNNQDPSEMLERLRSGLAGEAEPLRKFGVFISEARVQTEAYASGIAKAGEELTDAQKVQARFNIIMQDTAKQQGDFARTVGESLPNQIRVLKAEFIDLAATLGKQLIPVATTVVKALSAVADNIELVIAAAVGFAAFKILPELFLAMAVGLEKIGLAASANAAAGIGAFIGAMGPVAGLIGGAILAGNILNDTFFATDVSATQAAETIEGQLINALRAGQITMAEYEAAIKRANEQGGGLVEVSGEAGQALAVMQQKAALVEHQVEETAAATGRLTDAQRDLRLEVLAATNSFLGIELAARDLSEAQRTLNELERKGKEDTKAYEDAVLDALTAQIGLEEAVFSYGKELIDAGQKQGTVVEKIKDMGRELGISKGQVNDLIDRIRAYINEIERVPERVTTVFEAKRIGQIGSGNVGGPTDFQHGGVVHKTGLAMVHKGEVFSGVNNEMGFGMGIQGDIVLNIDGQTFARITRDQLLKLQNRNATSGI